MISWARMISFIKSEEMVIYTQNDEQAEYGGIHTLIEEKQLVLSNQFFFIRSNALEIAKINPQALIGDTSIAMYMEEDTPKEYQEYLLSILKKTKNCILFSSNQDFFDAYITLNRLFSVHAKMHSAITKLSQKIAKNKGIQELVDIIAEVFNNPVNITDNAYEVTASSTLEITDPYIKEVFYYDVVESNVLSSLKDKGYLSQIYSASQVVNIRLFHRQSYAIAIRYANITLGILSVFESNEVIDPMMLLYLPEIADLIAFEMSKVSDPHTDTYNNFTYLFYSLLESKTNTNRKILKKRLASFGYNLKQNAHLIYVDLKNASVLQSQIQLLAKQMQTFLKNSCYSLYQGNLLFLISRNADDSITDAELKRWEHRLKSNGYRIGISETFHEFDHFHMYYLQAKEACTTGSFLNPEQYIHEFSKIRISYMIHCITNDPEIQKMLLYPPLMKLIAFDKTNDSNLAETLFYYLKTPKQLEEICERLFIHKNTLFYRMKKAREIMGIDLYNADEITQVCLSFQLLHQMNLLPF